MLSSSKRRICYTRLEMLLNRFWRRHRGTLVKVLFFLSPFIPLALLKAPDLPRLNIYEHLQAAVVHPVSGALTDAKNGIGVLWSRYVSLVGTSKDNEVLLREKQALEARILELEELQQENARLHELLKMPISERSKFVTGRLMGQDSTGESLGFYINVGEAQGVKVRMPVVSHMGIVGTVIRVYRNSSVFVALQDPSHAVDGIIVRSRARFVVEGRGRPLTGRLKYLDRASDVRVGDLVVTSGLDRVFPKGLRVGYVIRTDRPQVGVSQTAEIRGAADLSYLEEVMVLLDAVGLDMTETLAQQETSPET